MARKIGGGRAGSPSLGGILAENSTVITAVENKNVSVSPLGSGIFEITNNTQLNASKALRFADTDSSNYVGFQAPATIASNVSWTLPDADASVSGYAMVSDGAGTLSFAAAGATVSADTTTNQEFVIYFSATTTGALTTAKQDSGFTYNPSTGKLTLTGINGSATQVSLTADNTTNATMYPLFANAATGDTEPRTDTGYTYNPNSGELTAVIVTASSDLAVKEDIQPLMGAMDMVKALNGYTYTRKSNKTQEIGVLAQDVEKVAPSLVRGEEGNKSVAYGNLVAVLIEAIKDQQEQITRLEKRLT
jgi:hypothetical protein